MVTGMLAVRNLILGEKNDLWSVNTDAEYHEEVQREQKKRTKEKIEEDIVHVFPRVDPVAFGLASGLTAGAVLLVATLFLIFKDGGSAGPHLGLLSNFLPGYSVSFLGALVGFVDLLAFGSILGSTFAYIRNLTVWISARIIHRDIEMNLLRRLFDFV
jgi:hypothetical protein